MSSVLRGHARAWLWTLLLGCASQAHAVDAVTPVAYSVVTAGSPAGTTPTTLTLMLPLPAALSDQPALGDGTLVRSADLPIWTIDVLDDGMWLWHFVGPGWVIGAYGEPPFWYSDAADEYAQVFSYLLPSGGSELRFSFIINLGCHGGCYNQSSLDLVLTRGDDALYTSNVDLSTLMLGATLSGYTEHDWGGSRSDYEYQSYWVDYTERWDFVGAPPVPEPATLALMLSGGAAAGLARRRRKPLAQPAQTVQ
jgi:hypothetical protein